MGSAQSNLFGPEAIAAGAIVAGAAVTAVALDNGWFGGSEKKPSAATTKGEKKSKEDREFDKLLAEAVAERRLMDAAVASTSATRVVGLPDVVPGSFEDTTHAESVADSKNKKKKKKSAATKKGGESVANSVLVTSLENSILQVPPAAVPAAIANEGSSAANPNPSPAKKSKKRKAANSAGAQTQSAIQPSAPASSGTPKAKPKVNTSSGAGNDSSDAWTRVEKRPSTRRTPSNLKAPLANSMTDADSAVSPASASASVSLTGDEHTTETSAPDTGNELTDKASADEDEAEADELQSAAASLTGVEEYVVDIILHKRSYFSF